MSSCIHIGEGEGKVKVPHPLIGVNSLHTLPAHTHIWWGVGGGGGDNLAHVPYWNVVSSHTCMRMQGLIAHGSNFGIKGGS